MNPEASADNWGQKLKMYSDDKTLLLQRTIVVPKESWFSRINCSSTIYYTITKEKYEDYGITIKVAKGYFFSKKVQFRVSHSYGRTSIFASVGDEGADTIISEGDSRFKKIKRHIMTAVEMVLEYGKKKENEKIKGKVEKEEEGERKKKRGREKEEIMEEKIKIKKGKEFGCGIKVWD